MLRKLSRNSKAVAIHSIHMLNQTEISSEHPVQGETGVWYTLDGRKLDAAMPDRKGIYIINGRKVVVR